MTLCGDTAPATPVTAGWRWATVAVRAGNEPSWSFKFHNHWEGPLIDSEILKCENCHICFQQGESPSIVALTLIVKHQTSRRFVSSSNGSGNFCDVFNVYDNALHSSFNYAMRQVFSVTVHHNLSTLLKLWIMHISGVCSELKYERETKLMVISTKKAPAEQSIVYFRGVDPLWE